ncbi:CAP domain-containing protein [Paraburkholderia hospita]|uniref:CAP domain-containing protein n=1 Tax=Paraburkholderia hospita TaxID=169430 RepID=UPI000B34288A|nr:CAP domain-containing protein [Paraburkholderia hospita]OUL91144.1 serine protease [Paraburkholderia hospita]
MKSSKLALTAVSIAAAMALAACGGGGGGGGSSTAAAPSTPASTPTAGNLTTPQYAADSAQLAAFNLLNQQRQQCGFPALQDNSLLDQAAVGHAQYMGLNGGTVTDDEVSGKPGFIGVSYVDRAAHFSYSDSFIGGVSGGYYTNAKLTETQYGQQLVYGWLSGVYHIGVGVWPASAIGIGTNETSFNGFPVVQGSMTLAHQQTIPGNMPLTYPCQGITGVAYSSGGETPTPPNTSGNWGTPIAVAGNVTDKVVLTAGTVTDTSGTVTTLQLLNSATDPNHLVLAYEAVAYPATPLLPNTTYAVSLTGTINGTAFSRSFSFTTGNIIG